MATRFTVVQSDEEHTADEWTHDADDDVLGCRGQGHHFPKLRRSRGPIRGINVRPPREGVFVIEATCPDCKTVRVERSLPGGELPEPHRYTYVYPANYRPPKGVKVTRRAAFNETWRRVAESVQASAHTA